MTVTVRKQPLGFTLVEIMTTVAIVGILASMAMPAFSKYARRARTSEAVMNLRKLYDGSIEYFVRQSVTRRGDMLQHRFPRSVRLTPGSRFCMDNSQGGKWVPNDAYWAEPTWQALSFGISDPHYYSYQYDSLGVDEHAMFTARAVGDLNCDQILSTFERVGTVDEAMNVSGGGGIYSFQEIE